MSTLNTQAPRADPPTTSGTPSTFKSSIPPLPPTTPARIDLLLSLHLHFWPALTHAIQSQWGGSSGTEKRDWFAGTLSDMFADGTIRDVEDLEDVLAQVMSDEFESVIEDGSLEDVSSKMWKGLEGLRRDDEAATAELGDMWRRWWEKRGKSEKVTFVRGPDEREGGEEDVEDDEDRDVDSDEEMEDAPDLVDSRRTKVKVEPEIDEDGFTKVVGRKGKR